MRKNLMKNIISSRQFDRLKLQELISNVDKIRHSMFDYATVLSNKIVGIVFFEPSTRTRMSFETAALRLGAKPIVVETSTGSSSVAKGESFVDTIKTVALYSDVLVVRANSDNAFDNIEQHISVPIISGGAGSGEHPTQALLDIYTIWQQKGRLDNLKIMLCGDLKYSRTIHSLVVLLSLYSNIELYCVSDDRLALSQEYADYAVSNNVVVHRCAIDDVPQDIDVVYCTRVQQERIDSRNAEFYSFVVSKQSMARYKHAIVMHPLPRNHEISVDFDCDKRAVYFVQAQNGLYVRMALLLSLCKA